MVKAIVPMTFPVVVVEQELMLTIYPLVLVKRVYPFRIGFTEAEVVVLIQGCLDFGVHQIVGAAVG